MVRSWGAAAVAALLLACWLCLNLLAHFSDADTVHEERRQQELMASFTARALGLRIETYQRVLQSMGQGVHSSMLDTPYLLELLLREDAGYAGIFDSLVMTGSDGSLVSYTPSGRSPFAGSALRDALRRTLSDGKPQVTYLSEENGDTHLGLLLTVPLRQANGSVRGALAGWVRVSMSSLLPQSDDGQRGASFMLVDAHDKLLAHSQGGYAAADITQVLGAYGARWSSLSSTSTSNADSQRWGPLLVTRVGMPLPRWQVVVVNDMSTRLLGMQRLTTLQWLGLAAIAMLVALALLALLWWLSRPLSQLLAWSSSHAGEAAAPMPLLRPARSSLHDKDTVPENAGQDEAQRIQQHWQSLERRRHASEHQVQSVESSLIQMLEAMPQGAVWARGSVLHYASRRAGDLLGKDRQSLQQQHLNQLLQNQPQARAWAQSASQSMAGFGHCRGELHWQLEGGAARWLHVEGQQLQAPAQGSLWLIHDAQHRRYRHSQSHWRTTHDVLTGALLPAALHARADAARGAQVRGTSMPCQAVLWVDVDYFAVLNATAGRAAGDEVLRQVAWLLRKEQGRHGLLARMGDDEFALWYSQAPDATTVQALAWRLCDVVRAWSPEFAGQRFVLGLSIGWLQVELPTGDLPALLHAAEQACRDAKQAGQGCAVQAYFQAAPQT